jgi:serine/threonine protein kinase
MHVQGANKSKPTLAESLPSCIVYQRGEALTEWISRSKPDTLAVLKMLCAVAQHIADIHAVGFVHRDIKPSNILWLPSTHLWTLLDYGCAAPIGTRLHSHSDPLPIPSLLCSALLCPALPSFLINETWFTLTAARFSRLEMI